MEEELNSLKASRHLLSQQIDESLVEINKQEGVALNKFNSLSEEYLATIEENKILNDEIKGGGVGADHTDDYCFLLRRFFLFSEPSCSALAGVGFISHALAARDR